MLQQATEGTISNIAELTEETRIYYGELCVYYGMRLFKKSKYSFSYLKNFPAYRNQAISNLRALNNRLLTANDEEKIIISNFIEQQLNFLNKLLVTARDALAYSSKGVSINDYLIKFHVQFVENSEITAKNGDFIANVDNQSQ